MGKPHSPPRDPSARRKRKPLPMALRMAPLEVLSDDMNSYFKQCEAAFGFVPNVLVAHCFSESKLRLFIDYYNDLMLAESELSKLDREIIGTVISSYNRCSYCVIAHAATVRMLSNDDRLAEDITTNYRTAKVSPRLMAMLHFAVKLTQRPEEIGEADRQNLRAEGLSDRSIWDLCAVAAYFNMSNRMAIATGVVPNAEYYRMGR